MPPKKQNQEPAIEVLRRTIQMNADLAAWVQWYAIRSGKTILTITDEIHRTYYEAHKDDFSNGPLVTSAPVDEVLDKVRRGKHRDA